MPCRTTPRSSAASAVRSLFIGQAVQEVLHREGCGEPIVSRRSAPVGRPPGTLNASRAHAGAPYQVAWGPLAATQHRHQRAFPSLMAVLRLCTIASGVERRVRPRRRTARRMFRRPRSRRQCSARPRDRPKCAARFARTSGNRCPDRADRQHLDAIAETAVFLHHGLHGLEVSIQSDRSWQWTSRGYERDGQTRPRSPPAAAGCPPRRRAPHRGRGVRVQPSHHASGGVPVLHRRETGSSDSAQVYLAAGDDQSGVTSSPAMRSSIRRP